VPITSYAHLPRGQRPEAFCPVCLERVFLHLGTRMRHHYAHRPEAECAAARGEGALHLSAKIHIAEQLADGGKGLTVRPVCARVPEDRSTERCPPAPLDTWDVEWDDVRVESTFPSLRADVMLFREGVEVGAIEIYAHHTVDAEKAEKYRRLGLPWIEVPARGVISEAGIGWTVDKPLAVLQDSRHPEPWRCGRHEALHVGMLEHERSGVHRMAGRVVHIYRSDGGRSKGETRVRATAVYMMERREDGELAEAWLERDDTEGRIGFPMRTRDRDDARRALHSQFAGWVRWMRENQGATVDSPMRWTPPRTLEGWKKSTSFPQRLRWDPHQGSFAAVPNLPTSSWPRVPRADPYVADPVLGLDGCTWTQLHPGKPPVMHAVAGAVWGTLRAQAGRTGAGEETAYLSACVHDGERWRTCDGAPYVATLAPEPDQDWVQLLQEWVRRLAELEPPAVQDGQAAVDVLGALRSGC
jgi:hypothetical protein